MIRDGNPEVLTPDLFASMSKTEQKQIRNYFGRRLDEEGRGFPNRPDDEAPMVVARRAYLQGTSAGYLVRAGLFIIAGPLLFSFFTAGEHDALTIGGFLVSLTLKTPWRSQRGPTCRALGSSISSCMPTRFCSLVPLLSRS